MDDQRFIECVREALDARILEVQHIDPGYPNSNDVWLVQTEQGYHIVKVSGHEPRRPQSGFWLGLETLFGCDPARELVHQVSLSDYLNEHGAIPVPRVVKCDVSNQPFGKPYVILERMPGCSVRYGSAEESEFVSDRKKMRQLGRHIGALHSSSGDACFGNYPKTEMLPPHEFPTRLAHTLEVLAADVSTNDPEVHKSLPRFVRMARDLSPPGHISLVMPDLVPGQFLSDEADITAQTDIESYVRGPVELELVVIESWISDAAAFQQGYEEVRGFFPNLREVRMAYRFFIYVLYGTMPGNGLAESLEAPLHFG